VHDPRPIDFAIAAMMIAASLFALFAVVPTNVSAFSSRNHILINGNGGFTNMSGVSWGSGTATDPFIIEGWEIDASAAHGIYVLNTNASFVVRDCYVHDGEMANYNGIYLYNCSNAIVNNDTCVDNDLGIYLDHCSNITVSENDIDYGGGFEAFICSNVNIIGNHCALNSFGIFVACCANSTVSWNVCHGNTNGIFAELCSDNVVIENNTVYGNQNGIYNNDAWNTFILGNDVYENSQYGIVMTVGSVTVTVVDNDVQLNGIGISVNLEPYWIPTDNISIHHNNLINNTVQATDNNLGHTDWDNGSLSGGNYWSDYSGTDSNSDGIGDTPYSINADSKDHFPLMTPLDGPMPPSPPDLSSPVTSIAFGGNLGPGGWYSTNVTVWLNATDTGSGVNQTFYQIGEGGWQLYTDSFEIASLGWHLISYYSIDKAGNEENMNWTYASIDWEAPYLIDSGMNGSTYYLNYNLNTVTLTWSAWDYLSGIHHCEYSIDQGTVKNTTANMAVFDDPDAGWHYINIRAIDNAGNMAEMSAGFYVLMVPEAVIYLSEQTVNSGDLVTVSGTLTFPNGDPCDQEQVTISLRDEQNNMILYVTTLTDYAGQFSRGIDIPQDLPTGEYSVVVGCSYDTWERSLNVMNPGRLGDVAIVLALMIAAIIAVIISMAAIIIARKRMLPPLR